MKKIILPLIACACLCSCKTSSECIVVNKTKIPQMTVKNTTLTITMPKTFNDTVRKDTTYVIPTSYQIACKCGKSIGVSRQIFDSIEIGDTINLNREL